MNRYALLQRRVLKSKGLRHHMVRSSVHLQTVYKGWNKNMVGGIEVFQVFSYNHTVVT
jgi:hypothetical protein